MTIKMKKNVKNDQIENTTLIPFAKCSAGCK